MSLLSYIEAKINNAIDYISGGPENNGVEKVEQKPAIVEMVNPAVVEKSNPIADTILKPDPNRKNDNSPETKIREKRRLAMRNYDLLCVKRGVDCIKLQEKLAAAVGAKNFNKLSDLQQATLLEAAINALSSEIKNVSKTTDFEKLVITQAKTVYKAVDTEKTFESVADAEKILKEKGNVGARKAFFKKLPNDAKESVKELDNHFNKQIEAIKNNSELSETEKAKQIKELKEKQKFVRHHIFNEALAMDSKTAINAMPILNSDDWGVGAQELLDTRADDNERERVASEIHNFEHLETMIATAMARGEEINTNSLKEYNTQFMAWKNEEAANAYQTAFIQARNDGKYGEDILISIAQGIGEGVVNNYVMTSEQKSDFIDKWQNDNKDLLREEYLTKNEFNAIKVLKNNIRTTSKSDGDNNSTAVETEYRLQTSTFTNSGFSTNPMSKVESNNKMNNTSAQSLKSEKVNLKGKSDSQIVEMIKADANISYNDVERSVGRDKAFKLMVSDITLRSIYLENIKNFISHSTDVRILINETKSTDVLQLVWNNIPEKLKPEYIEQVEKSASSTMKKVIEQYKEQQNKNAVN